MRYSRAAAHFKQCQYDIKSCQTNRDFKSLLRDLGITPLRAIQIVAAKEGLITISKKEPEKGPVYSGHTVNFGVGLSLFVDYGDGYYYTSPIEYIDYENKVFKTKNSVYDFNFKCEDCK